MPRLHILAAAALAALSAWLLPPPAQAQAAAQARAAATLPSGPAKPALFVVRDADTTIYMFGTFHLLPPGLDWLRGPVATALDAADELVLEVPLPDPDPEATRLAVEQLARDPAGQPLETRIAAEVAAQAKREAEAAGIPWEGLSAARPWFVAIALQIGQFQKLGLGPATGAEMTLVQQAQKAGKPVSGIETVASQFRLLADLPPAREEDLLRLTLDNLDSTPREVPELLRQWAAGDIEALGRALTADTAKFPELQKTVVFDRNARFAAWVRARLERPGTVFFAVGAGHLPGERGMLEALRGIGIKSTRLQ